MSEDLKASNIFAIIVSPYSQRQRCNCRSSKQHEEDVLVRHLGDEDLPPVLGEEVEEEVVVVISVCSARLALKVAQVGSLPRFYGVTKIGSGNLRRYLLIIYCY